ncbi:hypothetical protein PISMIDRAFT_19507 [Pisolithus microcarpus 441]|uniref:Uncharacterized protein n=1 Tax=Pisolithus microcarpus 441 TaxID=765257 RepID=A0A0C9XGP4_9AGAM|nr:hypothetical protein PISMIDRAFT_19507 [Pisolithus microcarpus 441]
MELPEGYPAPQNLSRPVAKLNVALYGSKQGALSARMPTGESSMGASERISLS